MCKAAKALGVTADYLLDDSLGEPPKGPELSEQDRTILETARTLGYQEAFRRLIYAGSGIVPMYPYEPPQGPS